MKFSFKKALLNECTCAICMVVRGKLIIISTPVFAYKYFTLDENSVFFVNVDQEV